MSGVSGDCARHFLKYPPSPRPRDVFLCGGRKVLRARVRNKCVALLVLDLNPIEPAPPGASQLNSSLLTISVIAVLLPAAFHFSVPGDSAQESSDILSLSHGVCTPPSEAQYFVF